MATTPSNRLPERPLDPTSRDHAGYCPNCGGPLDEDHYNELLVCLNEECGHSEPMAEDPRGAEGP